MEKKDLKKQHIIQIGLSLVILILIAFIASKVFFRIDITSEKRYTLSSETKTILKGLNESVYVKVYLDGDLPVGFKKLRNSIRETLDEFRVYGKDNVQYEFINPSENNNIKLRNQLFSELMGKGLKPVNLQSQDKEGGSSEKIIFPGAIVSFNGIEIPISFLKNNPNLSADENLNNSIQGIEYELIQKIHLLTSKQVDKIAFIEGHGELNEYETSDITSELSNYFEVDRGIINGTMGILDPYKAIIIAKPTKPFSEADKLVIDQYVMNGGKVLWFIDEVNVNTDSLVNGSTLGLINNCNIDDQLFKYGVRINPNLIQDIQCNVIPINTAPYGEQPKWTPSPWFYLPLVSPLVDHPVTRNLNLILTKYPSQIDTVGNGGKVKKTILLKSSNFTRLVKAPLGISLAEVRNPVQQETFNSPNQTMAVLLEGQFTSLFRNRMVDNVVTGSQAAFKGESVPTKMLVVADGDLPANDVRMTAKGPMISPLGYDKYTRQTFGNKEFIANAVSFMTDESSLINLRSKEFKLRILDKQRLQEEKLKWQIINTLLPVLLIIAFGIGFNYIRKRKYAK
jgi:gliding-associated putative ABC transporter substrate-binding component GldG